MSTWMIVLICLAVTVLSVLLGAFIGFIINQREGIMKNFFVLIFMCMILPSCANKLLKKAPVLAPEETYWEVEEKLYDISHNKCKKRNGDNRKCKRVYSEVKDKWNLFYPGHIIIKKDTCF